MSMRLEGTMVRVLTEYTSFDGHRVAGEWVDPCMVVCVKETRGKHQVTLMSPDGAIFREPLQNIVPCSSPTDGGVRDDRTT